MRDFKFDIDVILRNCERFGVKVERNTGLHGVTMNGKTFDVTEEMENAFNELRYPTRTEISKDIVISGASQITGKRMLDALFIEISRDTNTTKIIDGVIDGTSAKSKQPFSTEKSTLFAA